jgi:hypothetical protein
MEGRRDAEQALARDLPGVAIVEMSYRRRDRAERRALRDHFDEEVRGNFLRHLAETQGGRLLRSGLTPANLESMTQGRAPRGYQVHHIRPLDDGGTNDFGNLVLIRAHPEHEAVHRYLDPQIATLAVGQARMVRLPAVTPGFHAPTAARDGNRAVRQDTVLRQALRQRER